MSEKALKTTTYQNLDTGEFVEKKSWVDLQFNDNGYLFRSNNNSVKSYLDCPMPQELTWAEKGRLLELRHYILKDNQLLVYRSHGTIKPVDIPEISRILEMSGRQAQNLMQRAAQCKVIKEIQLDGLRYFMFNPVYAFKGKRLTLDVYIMFQEELKSILPKWVVSRFLAQAKELRPNIRLIK